MRTFIDHNRNGESTHIVFVSVDLAKNFLAALGGNEAGRGQLVRPALPRGKLLELVAGLPNCTIGMDREASLEWMQGRQGKLNVVRRMQQRPLERYAPSGV